MPARLVRDRPASTDEAARRREEKRPEIVSSSELPPRFRIGEWTVIGDGVEFLFYISTEGFSIGRFCSIGHNTTIFVGGNHRTDVASTFAFDYLMLDQPFPSRTYQTTRDTVIGNDVWIGRDSMIMGGVQIGDGAVIGAGAVVMSDVPPYAIAAGNPAEVVRYRFSPGTVERMLRIAWWNWSDEKVRENIEWMYAPINEFVARFDPEEE